MIQDDDPTTAASSFPLPEDPEDTYTAAAGTRRPAAEPFWSNRVEQGLGGNGSGDHQRVPDMKAGGAFLPRNLIGKGGSGEVWEAWQVSLRRPVALKRLHMEIHEGGFQDSGEDSFRQEAFVTASLEHPNIVPVYDLGTDDVGRPILAMKLVRGEPWNRIIARDLAELPALDLLGKHLPILASVAQAVAFAHDRGIVHRDLKPSQVMLGRFGEVQLMDWGLSVSIRYPESEAGWHEPDVPLAPFLNEAASPAGTPTYMAPEQTLLHARNVGTWTDVYLLGGILYALLTGKPPHHAANSYHAMMKARQGDVVPPSEMVPDRDVPQELEDLAMHALQPNPADRVPSAEAFLLAINEYLSGATRRRESREIMKAIRSSMGARPETYADLTNLLNLVSRAQLLWPESKEAAALHAELLEAKARLALRGGDLLLAEVVIDGLQGGEVERKLRRQLDQALHARRQRERERARLRWATACLLALMVAGGAWGTSRLNAQRQTALVQRDQAMAARAEAEDLVGFMLGDLTDKVRPIGRLDILDDVVSKVNDVVSQREQAGLLPMDRPARIRLFNQLAVVRFAQGRFDEAAAVTRQAVAEAQAVAESDPGYSEAQGLLISSWVNEADILHKLGAQEDADRAVDRALLLAEARYLENPNDLGRMSTLAAVLNRDSGPYMARGQYVEARECFLRSLKLSEQVAARQPGLTNPLREVGIGWGCVAATFEGQGMIAEARDAHERSLGIFEALNAAEPDNNEWLCNIATSLDRMGGIFLAEGKPQEALESYLRGRSILEKVSAYDPENETRAFDLAIAWGRSGQALEALGKRAEAAESYREAIARHRKLIAANPANIGLLTQIGAFLSSLGNILQADGNHEEALDLFQSYVAVSETLVATYPGTLHRKDQASRAWYRLANLHAAMGSTPEAEAAYLKSIAIMTETAESDPGSGQRVGRLAEHWDAFGKFLATIGRDEAAAAAAEQARAIRKGVDSTKP